jgi:hypothetical protein
MSIADIYNNTAIKCNTAKSIYDISNTYYHNQTNNNGLVFSDDIHDATINYAFLMVFTAFEEFLEKTFIAYMLNEPGINGVVAARYVTPRDEGHAMSILKGINRYPDFTNTDTIRAFAENYFANQGPFIVLSSMTRIFEEMKKVRNAITHISDDSYKKFKDMITTILGNWPNNFNTSSFLNTIETNSQLSYFNYYRDQILVVINQIANP